MRTSNIGNPQRTSIDERPDGTQTYRNMTMRSSTSQEKLIYQQTLYPVRQELTKEKMTIKEWQ
jgi:hypothetical protein